jgi:hypothetical protein
LLFEDPNALNGFGDALPADDDEQLAAGRRGRAPSSSGGDGRRRLRRAAGGAAAARAAADDDDDDSTASEGFESEVEIKDLYNWDGGSAYRLSGGRILVAFTSTYNNRLWNELYSMRAYEVDKDGEVIVTIVVPHDSDALEHQGAYRFIPWATTAGESNTAPFDLATKAVQPSWRRRARL